MKMFSMSGVQSYAKKHTFKKHDFFLKEEKAKIPSLVMLLKHKESTCVRCHNPRDFDKVLYVKEGSKKTAPERPKSAKIARKITLFLQKLQIVVPCKKGLFSPLFKITIAANDHLSELARLCLCLTVLTNEAMETPECLASISVKLARPGVSAIIYKREREDIRENKKRAATER